MRARDTSPSLVPAGPEPRRMLFLLTMVLPLAMVAAHFAMGLLAARPMTLVAGSLPLTIAATVLAVGIFMGVAWRVLAAAMDRQALRLDHTALEVDAGFHRTRMALAAMHLDKARLIDLDEHVELLPRFKRKAFSVPGGFRSGWYQLRNRRRAFVATGEGRQVLWLPCDGDHDLLLEVRDPRTLLAQLRTLAAASRPA